MGVLNAYLKSFYISGVLICLLVLTFSIVIRFLSLAYFLRFAKLSYNRSKSFVNAIHNLNN